MSDCLRVSVQRRGATDLVIRRWGSGPTVVLVHGALTGAHASWAHLRGQLPGWTLLAPNRRGYHPRTPAEREDYRIDAVDLLGLLDEPAHVVGHSYGAVVALLAANQMPHYVQSLTLVEPPPLAGTHHLPVVREWLDRMGELREAGPAEHHEFLARFMALVGGPDDHIGYADQMTEQIRLLRTSVPVWTADPDVEPLIVSGTPTLVMSGGHSAVFEAAADSAAAALGAKRRVLLGAGHFVQRDPRFATALSAFLNSSRSLDLNDRSD